MSLTASKYRNDLPQLSGTPFLTEAGLETSLVFQHNVDLPEFAAFVMLESEEGRQLLRDQYDELLPIAADRGVGFIIATNTWRASADWGQKIGYDQAALDQINDDAVKFAEEMRAQYESQVSPILISGTIGPRGDGYRPGELMSIEEARVFHSHQINLLADTTVDYITAETITNIEEAAGIALAAKDANIPCVISFTVETDGRLPTGDSLSSAIKAVDGASDSWPAYYMINCAHTSHFEHVLHDGAGWMDRIRGLRANASKCSHEELDNSTELDDGDPVELGNDYQELIRRFPQINVVGGCCGTDHRHIREISASLAA